MSNDDSSVQRTAWGDRPARGWATVMLEEPVDNYGTHGAVAARPSGKRGIGGQCAAGARSERSGAGARRDSHEGDGNPAPEANVNVEARSPRPRLVIAGVNCPAGLDLVNEGQGGRVE